MSNRVDQFCNQAANTPIESADSFQRYLENLDKLIAWENVGLLTDEENRNLVTVLIDQKRIVASLRICLEPNQLLECLTQLSPTEETFEFRSYQGHTIEPTDLESLTSLSEIWDRAHAQSVKFNTTELETLLTRIEGERKEKGRGKSFSTSTINQLLRESHGRCMFKGCGQNLEYDEVTGASGNFAYLAHNVPASENGPRGIIGLSKPLADDPSNVLYLCDKHHRLIDKVAACDYTAAMLTEMKQEFITISESLLDGLKYEPIPVYAVLWPVNSQTVSPPNQIQISKCLSTFNRRMYQQINVLSDNEELLKENPDIMWKVMDTVIKNTADKLLQQTKEHKYNAALFGFGPSSALIGLGACLGNKSEIKPMLRFRDEFEWHWPNSEPVGDFYEIDGLNELVKNENVVLNISLTAEPPVLKDASLAICERLNTKLVTIRAKEEFMGNGAISHPSDGEAFSSMLQALFHRFKAEFNVKTVHLFTCASNAACIFIGQAFDNLLPEMVVYDFDNSTMAPRLLIESRDHKCLISVAK